MTLTKFKIFLADQSGAVTVDWVVLTAALVGLGMAAMAVVSVGVENASGNITTELSSLEPLADPFVNSSQRAADGIE